MTDSSVVEMTRGETESLTLLQAAADPVRWQVLALLARAGACVCDLQSQVPVAPNLLSYHLRVLREAGLVTATRRGRWMDYALAADAPDRLTAALPVAAGPAPEAASFVGPTAEPESAAGPALTGGAR